MSILLDTTPKRDAADCGDQNNQGASGTRNLQDQANDDGSNRTDPTVAVAACVSPQPRTMLDVVREEREQVLRAYWAQQGCVRDVDEDELYQSLCLRREDLKEWYRTAERRIENYCKAAGTMIAVGQAYQDPLTHFVGIYKGAQETPVEIKKPLFTETLDDPGDDEDVFLIDNCLVEGQPMFVGGKSKTMKTAILADLAFALSAGAGYRFLDKFTVLKQCNVGMFSGESGKTTLKRRWRTIKAARSKLGATIPPVRVEYKVPALSAPEEIQRIVAAIHEYKLNVLIFDPLYLGLLRGNRKVEPGNVFAMGELLTGIVEACVAEGCTPVFAHHDKKSADNSKDTSNLEDFTMAGFAEFARQWIKVKRRPGKPYVSGSGVHHLNINVEGSAGFGSAYSFTIDEGTCKEPKWVVSSEPLISSREDKKREKEAAQMVEVRAERQRMYEAIAACPNISTRRIRDVVKIGLDKAESHLAALLAERRICEGTPTQKGGSAWKAC